MSLPMQAIEKQHFIEPRIYCKQKTRSLESTIYRPSIIESKQKIPPKTKNDINSFVSKYLGKKYTHHNKNTLRSIFKKENN